MEFIVYEDLDLDHEIGPRCALVALIAAFNHELTGNTAKVNELINDAGAQVGLYNLALATDGLQKILCDNNYSREVRLMDEKLHFDQVMFHIRHKRQMRSWENDVVKGYGYTKWQMECAFHDVCNPDDWKAPIDAYLNNDPDYIDQVVAAIVFFTATEPVLDYSPEKVSVRITADGYRRGPAGDH